MVNTFLVDTDFRISASKLDNRRLGKQRVEAYQILIALTQLRFLAKYFGIPDYPIGLDTPKERRDEWIHSVLSTFKRSGYIAMLIRGNMLIGYQSGHTVPRKPKSGNKLLYDSLNNWIYEVSGKRQKIVASGPPDVFVLPGEELITTGFRKHTAVSMWLGFEDALRDYINAHIETWISRGKNNTMKTYIVPENYPRPCWSFSRVIINKFKSALIQKEIERHELAWYLNQPDFVEAWAHSPDYASQVNVFVKLLPTSQWYNYVNKNLLLAYGHFTGYIWP